MTVDLAMFTTRNVKRTTANSSPLAKRCKFLTEQLSGSTEVVKSGCFTDLHIFVLPTGIGSSRCKILQAQTVANGGIVHNIFSNSITHIVVEDTLTVDKICKILKWSIPPAHVKLVKTQWISNCLKSGNFIDTKDYELHCNNELIGNYSTENKTSCNNGTQKISGSASSNGDLVLSDKREIPGSATAVSNQHKRQNAWICSVPSNQHSVNHNKFITDKLEILAETYKNTRDHWRAVGYEKAIIALKNHPKEITSWEEAKSLRGVGERLADKIWEIVQSGHLRKIDEVCSGEKVIAISLFTKVWGIGPSTAEMFVQQGFRTLDDLRIKAKLTKPQQIGLKYFVDLQDRMLRSEAAEIISIVKRTVTSVDPSLDSVSCGSYRRGRETCGDVDILITHPDGKSHLGVLPKVVSALHNTGLLTDDLVSQEDNGNQKKYMGICKLLGDNEKFRRIDIIVVPFNEYACALMHFTGSAYFNRSIRLLASKKAMSLSEHSLRAGIVRKGQEKITDGYPLPTPDEESIFQHLGLEYRPPEERDHFGIE